MPGRAHWLWSTENLHWISLLHFCFKREGAQILIWSPALFPPGTFPVSVLSSEFFWDTSDRGAGKCCCLGAQGRRWVMQVCTAGLRCLPRAAVRVLCSLPPSHSSSTPAGHMPISHPNWLPHSPCRVLHNGTLLFLVSFLSFWGKRDKVCRGFRWALWLGRPC